MTKSKRLLKIGFVLDGGLEEPDGVQQYILTLGNYFKSLGHQVRYVVAGKAVYGGDDAVSLNNSLRVRSNGNKLSVPLPAKRGQLKRFMKDEQFDVLHVQTPYSPMMGEQLIRLAEPRVAIIGTFHFVPRYFFLSIADYFLGLWSRPSIKRFDSMVSVSETAKHYAKRDFGVDSEVLPNCIDFNMFNKAKRESINLVPTIVFLGRLVERKGCIQLLSAIELLSKRSDLPKFRVVIGGKGPLETRLKSFVSSKNLKQIVEFRGFIAEEDKPEFFASADIAVFPSQGGESFGIVLLEALSSGNAAVLAGDNIGYSEVMKERQELIFPRKDYHVLADKIAVLLQNKDVRTAYAKWGEDYARGFDVKVIGDRLLYLYTEALLKRRG